MAQKPHIKYRPAKLYMGKTEWYAYYFFENPETLNFDRIKERFDINRIKNLSDRRIYGEELVKFLNTELEAGFNPFTDERPEPAGKRAEPKHSITTILQRVLEIMLQDCASSCTKTYKQMHARFGRWLKSEEIENVPIDDIDGEAVKRFQKWMFDDRLAKKTINSSISHMGLFWDTAIESKFVSANPFRSIAPVKKRKGGDSEVDLYEPITLTELRIIFDWLNSNGYRCFVRFLAFIYYAWARPVEITRLKISNIDLEAGVIVFRKGDTKNDKGANVQIVPQLKAILEEMNLSSYPRGAYLFSGPRFMPDSAMKDSNEISILWRELVQDGLQIRKKMYALKHTGNIHYLLNNKGNIDLKWQQMQNRHSSAAMTEKYNRALGAYFIDLKGVKFTDI